MLRINNIEHYYFHASIAGLYKVAKDFYNRYDNLDIKEPVLEDDYIEIDSKYLQEYLDVIKSEFFTNKITGTGKNAGEINNRPENNIYRAKKYPAQSLIKLEVPEITGSEKVGYCYCCGVKSSLVDEFNSKIFPSDSGTGYFNFNNNLSSNKQNGICFNCSYVHWFIGVFGSVRCSSGKTQQFNHLIPFTNSLKETYRFGMLLRESNTDILGGNTILSGELFIYTDKKTNEVKVFNRQGSYINTLNTLSILHHLQLDNILDSRVIVSYNTEYQGNMIKTVGLDFIDEVFFSNYNKFIADIPNSLKVLRSFISSFDAEDNFILDRISEKILSNKEIVLDICNYLMDNKSVRENNYKVNGLMNIIKGEKTKVDNFNGFGLGRELRDYYKHKGDTLPSELHKLHRCTNEGEVLSLLVHTYLTLGKNFTYGEIDFSDFETTKAKIVLEILRGYTYKSKNERGLLAGELDIA